MKNLFFLLITLFFFACSKDVVEDRDPVNTNDWRTELVTQLRSAQSDAERSIIMEEN